MDTERLGRSPILNRLLKPAGWLMASSLRKLVFDPQRTLEGARLQAGEVVLEVGCGTGFFTVPAAQLVGEQGKVIALDVMVGYLEEVAARVARAGLQNVELLRRDALDTGLGDKCVDTVLLFGVIPFPSLPLRELLPEMHRVLRPGGGLALWQFPAPGWVPRAVVASGLFTLVGKHNGVHRFERN